MDPKVAPKIKKRVLTSHRRRISSVLSQSPTKLNASKGDIKRKINVLIKNNKTLAVALEDTQCELSSKQKLLEKASEYFKSIMLARVKMTQMWSALNSVIQDFGGTMEMLKCDNFKLSDITPPFQSSKQFKKEMRKLAEAVGSVSEESSFLCNQEDERSDCDNSPEPSLFRNCASSNFNPTVMEVTEDVDDKPSLSSDPAILRVSASPDPITTGSPSAKSKALVDPGTKEEETSIASDFLIARNDTGTPKLSLPSVILPIDLQKNPGAEFSLLNEKDSSVVKKLSKTPEKKSSVPIKKLLKGKDSSVKNFSKIPEALNKPKSSQKDLNSKIPRFHAARNIAAKVTSFSAEVSKEKSVSPKIFNKKNIIIPKEMNEIDCRRKPFVVKKSDSETAVTPDEEEVADLNDLEDELNSETFASRKTFVVKSSSALEKKRKSVKNKRKTFVKNNSPKSIKIRRGTFVLTGVNENCTEEDKLLTASECDDVVKEESSKPCAVTVKEALPPDSNDPCEMTQKIQLSKKNFFMSDNPEMEDQESNSKELSPEINSEGTLNKQLENPLALEKKCKSVSDKRKSSVKKQTKSNSRKSIKNKRSTFVLTDIDENCTEEDQLLMNLVNPECDDLVKEKLNKPCTMAVDEALPSASFDAFETTQNLQLLKMNCFIKDKPGMMIQESNSEKLLPEVSSEGALKKKLVNSSGITDVNKQEDTRVVKFAEIDCLKSTVLSQKSSVELPVLADKTANKAKASKEEKSNCTAVSVECNNGQLLLKSSNRRKTCVTVSHDKHISSKVETLEKEPAILQTFSQEPQVQCSNNTTEESERKSVPETELNKNEGESSLKFKETNEKCESGIKYAMEGIEKEETNEKNLGFVDLISDDEIIILDNGDNKRKSRARKRISYKMFLEESGSESISEVEHLESFEDKISSLSLAKTPVRGKVSFSNKKKYVFSRKSDAKIKPQKYKHKLKNCKNLTNNLISANALNTNCDDNILNTDINQMSENAGENPLLHCENAKGEKKEISPKCRMTICNKRETMLNTEKIPEKLVDNRTNSDVKNHKNSKSEILDEQNDKNINKTILPSNSPVISLDKCLNNIECYTEDRNEKTNLGDTAPKIQNFESDDGKNIKKQTHSAKDKMSKRKARPKKKKKQVIESNVEKENVEVPEVNNKEEAKPSNQNNRAKNSKDKKLATDNAIVVEAEIHPLPRTLNQLDTNVGNTTNYEVAVVLSDIFQSKKIDLLSVNNKEKRDRNFIASSPLSNNSSNIQRQPTNKSDVAKEVENEDLADCRRSKRARAVNYAEPNLHKKMRR